MLFCHMLPEQCVRVREREGALSHIFILAIQLMLLSSINDVREEYAEMASGTGFLTKNTCSLEVTMCNTSMLCVEIKAE